MLGFSWIKRILERRRARSLFIDFMIKLNGSSNPLFDDVGNYRSRLNNLSDEELLEQAKTDVPGMSRLIALLPDKLTNVDILGLLASWIADHNLTVILEETQKRAVAYLAPLPQGGFEVRSSAPYSQGSSDAAMLSEPTRRW